MWADPTNAALLRKVMNLAKAFAGRPIASAMTGLIDGVSLIGRIFVRTSLSVRKSRLLACWWRPAGPSQGPNAGLPTGGGYGGLGSRRLEASWKRLEAGWNGGWHTGWKPKFRLEGSWKGNVVLFCSL
jgi:hypothetical protein